MGIFSHGCAISCLLQRDVSSRELGWVDPSLPPALAVPVFPPPVIWFPQSWLSLLPKESPKSLGRDQGLQNRQARAWLVVLVPQLEVPGPCLVPF